MGKYDVGLPDRESTPSFIARARQNLFDMTEPYTGKNAEYAERVRSMRDLCLKALDCYERDYKVALETARQTLEVQLQHECTRVEMLERQIADRKRADEGLAEVWNDDPHDRRVTFKGRSAHSRGQGVVFNVGQLETMAYRARMGGGTDTTEIDFFAGRAEAQLLAPENVVDLSGGNDSTKDLQENKSDGAVVKRERETPFLVGLAIVTVLIIGGFWGAAQLVQAIFG